MALIVGILATVPAIVLLVYIYRKDKVEREPIGLLALLFLGGCVIVLPASTVEMLMGALISPLEPFPIVYKFVDNFFGVALVEEGFKFAVLLFAWRNKAFDHLFDGVVYAVCVSLGFAALENVFYVLDAATIDESLSILAARTVLSIPGHMFFGVFMGLWFGRAKCASLHGDTGQYKRSIALSLIYPIAAHGFYDFCLSFESAMILLIFLIFVAALYVIAFRTIRNASKADACFADRAAATQGRLQPAPQQTQPSQAQPAPPRAEQRIELQPQDPRPRATWYCTECGQLNNGRFCTNCGTKRP